MCCPLVWDLQKCQHIGGKGENMGNIGYIFGYGLFFAFCLGVVVGYLIKKIIGE